MGRTRSIAHNDWKATDHVRCVWFGAPRTFVAVGERGMDPSIYIYTYPTLQVRASRLSVSCAKFRYRVRLDAPSSRGLQIVKVLRGGTTYAYSDLAFNDSGDKLASVGSSPDFMLTVWDWENER